MCWSVCTCGLREESRTTTSHSSSPAFFHDNKAERSGGCSACLPIDGRDRRQRLTSVVNTPSGPGWVAQKAAQVSLWVGSLCMTSSRSRAYSAGKALCSNSLHPAQQAVAQRQAAAARRGGRVLLRMCLGLCGRRGDRRGAGGECPELRVGEQGRLPQWQGRHSPESQGCREGQRHNQLILLYVSGGDQAALAGCTCLPHAAAILQAGGALAVAGVQRQPRGRTGGGGRSCDHSHQSSWW
jgi:hypothetical protein